MKTKMETKLEYASTWAILKHLYVRWEPQLLYAALIATWTWVLWCAL